MAPLINIALPVFGIILTGYFARSFDALGPDATAGFNRCVFVGVG
jgi:predicted permease